MHCADSSGDGSRVHRFLLLAPATCPLLSHRRPVLARSRQWKEDPVHCCSFWLMLLWGEPQSCSFPVPQAAIVESCVQPGQWAWCVDSSFWPLLPASSRFGRVKQGLEGETACTATLSLTLHAAISCSPSLEWVEVALVSPPPLGLSGIAGGSFPLPFEQLLPSWLFSVPCQVGGSNHPPMV